MAYVINYWYTVNIGKCRQNNQDNLFCVGDFLEYENNGVDGIKSGQKMSTDLPIFGVFDGMGGEECGEIAAYIAAKSLSAFSFSKDIKKAIPIFANQPMPPSVSTQKSTKSFLWEPPLP